MQVPVLLYRGFANEVSDVKLLQLTNSWLWGSVESIAVIRVNQDTCSRHTVCTFTGRSNTYERAHTTIRKTCSKHSIEEDLQSIAFFVFHPILRVIVIHARKKSLYKVRQEERKGKGIRGETGEGLSSQYASSSVG